jgi:tetratricopeptide (TPR) repeat protein
MNTVTCTPDRLVALLTLLMVFLTGCQHLNAIRLEQDRPADLAMLMALNEYGRAEHLLHQYPELDTPKTRGELNERIANFEDAVLADAKAMESTDNLYGAHGLLVEALQKLPDSRRLNEHMCQLEAKRSERLNENQRRELLAQAEYYVSQQEIYNEHLSLAAPSLIERVKIRLLHQQAEDLAGRLLACGQKTMAKDQIDLAETCLRYARQINDGPGVREALAKLESRRAARRQSEEKKVRVTWVRDEKKPARKHREKTQEVLEKTEQALKDNELAMAQEALRNLPEGANETEEVEAVRTRLNEEIDSTVRALIRRGDRQYRADYVGGAIRTWEQALELDPDNAELNKRLERARKVLARLEELRKRQRRRAKQSRQGT